MAKRFALVQLMGLVALGVVGAACSSSDSGSGNGKSETMDGPGPVSATDPNDPAFVGDPADPERPVGPIVSGLAISEIAVLQGVKVSVVKNGTLTTGKKRNAPVVADRPALIRVYVTPSSDYAGQPVTAELRLVGGTTKFAPLRDTKTVAAPSRDDDPKSTFNFEVPAASLPPGVTFQVALTSKDGKQTTDATDARFPQDGSLEVLGAEASGKVKIVLVPVKYDADGSGRLPDLGAAQLERFKNTFMARYPTSDVEITVHAPYPWTSPIARNGNGFSQILRAMTQLRQAERADDDVYYYGAFAPSSSMNTFCGSGCVTGLSAVAELDTPYLRASVGVSYPGDDAANTMAHEVGHAHGREHAPCGGAQGVDPEFPYDGGTIGVWGYNLVEKTFISPSKGKDMMGYCPNEWVSDYTFDGLFQRIAGVNASARVVATRSAKNYRMATVDADGTLTWGGAVELAVEPSGGSPREARFVGAAGATLKTATARFFPFDHLPGGFLVVPESDVAWTHVQIAGTARALAR